MIDRQVVGIGLEHLLGKQEAPAPLQKAAGEVTTPKKVRAIKIRGRRVRILWEP